MKLVNGKKILIDAQKNNQAIGAFNFTSNVSVSKKSFICKGVFSLLSSIVEGTSGANSAAANAFVQFSHTIHTKLAH